MAGGALRAVGLGEQVALAGKTAVDAGLTAGSRFIPRAIMTGATFGTRTFIAETVKAFQDGGVDLEQFGKDVLKDTAFGAMLGTVGGLAKPVTSVASAGALGFLSTKMSGGDNREASLNGAIWAAFETVGSFGKTADLRLEALQNLKESIGEYAEERNPGMGSKTARNVASQFVDNAMKKAGFDTAEDVAKNGPEDLLEGIEKVNQQVRNAKVPASEPSQLQPKLPAPVTAETSVAPQEPTPTPQTPIEKIVDSVKTAMGIKPEAEPFTPNPKGYATHEDMMDDLKKQGHDISALPESAFPDDMKDIHHFEQARTQGAEVSKSVSEISERLNRNGINEPERNAVYGLYDINKKGSLGQTSPVADLINQPIEDQYKTAYQALASQRGIDKGDKFDSRTMEDATKAVDLINGYFSPKSQNLLEFAKQHPDVSDHDVAQMAHDHGLLEEPNNDLLKTEIQKAKQEKPIKPIGELPVVPSGSKTGEPHALFSYNDTFGEGGTERSIYNIFGDPNNEIIKKAGWGSSVTKDRLDELGIPITGREPRSVNFKQMKTDFQMVGTAPRIEKPVVQQVASQIKASTNEITNLVVPANAAPLAGQITRENLGKMARSYDMAEASLKSAKDLFDKQSKEDNLDFIDKMERELVQKTEDLNVIALKIRNLLDSKRKEIQALGTGKLKSFFENYFPHIWDQGEDEVGQVIQKASKRPFEGQKSFLKKRTIEFTKDGVAMGLTPVSYNPVDLALLKIREMDKYLMAHRTIQAYKANGLARYVKVGDDIPDGWTKIDDRISTVFKSPMIAVKEAYDQKMMDDLNKVAKSLGIDLERGMKARGKGNHLKDVWGLSMSDASAPGTPGKIFTRFAGPESALAHELGHQLDHIYGLQGKFLSDPAIDKELTNLANERATDGVSKSFREYIQKPSEKMAAMLESYIHAPELLKEVAPKTYEKLTEFLKNNQKLEPLTAVKPSLLMGTNESEVYAGGNVIAGHIYAQPDAARIINNYLSPGLQKSAAYQTFRYAGNLINQFQLGFSAFHLGFTSLDASISKFALALNQLASGHPLSAAKAAIETPVASIQNIIRGNNLLKAWRGEGRMASDDVLAQAMATAGGRARMDQFYATKALDQMKHHFQAGNLLRGVLHFPLTVIEASSKPILEWIVPRQKLGVFSDIMKMEMEHNPNMTHAQMREIAQRAWDSVDNRMGQLVYDNLFWNRTFKDLLMASVRSVGWNLGTIRELAGGAKDYAEAANDLAHGKKTDFTYRMAYFAALPIVVGTLGAMIQYLRTGKGPQEMKDYFFPKTGGVDANGQPTRMALPSYMKDLYAYEDHPLRTMINKLNPILSAMGQMYENKDFYGVKIRNEDDSIVKQALAEAEYMLKLGTPFSIRNMQKNKEGGNNTLLDTVGPWVGITPAPYDINQTKAEKLAHEIAMSHQEIGGRTQEQADKSHLVNMLTRQYRSGDPKATDDLYKAYEDGLISHRQMQDVIVNSHLTPLQRLVKRMTPEEAEQVYAKSNDEEKAQLEVLMERKFAKKGKEFVSQ